MSSLFKEMAYINVYGWLPHVATTCGFPKVRSGMHRPWMMLLTVTGRGFALVHGFVEGIALVLQRIFAQQADTPLPIPT